MFPSVLEHTLTIVCFCGIILTQEFVLLSMVFSVIQLYHRRTFSCFLFVTYVLYLNIFAIFAQQNPIYAKYFNNESGTKAIRILTKNKAYDYNVRYN